MSEPKKDNGQPDQEIFINARESRMRKGGINPLPAHPSPPPPPPPPQTPAELLRQQGSANVATSNHPDQKKQAGKE